MGQELMLVGGGKAPVYRWVSGRYYFAPNTMSISTSATLGVGTLRAVPFWIPMQTTLSKLGAEVTIVGDAGSVIRLGLYADDGSTRPGALVVDGGTILGDSATLQEVTISTVVGPGIYWAAAVVQNVTVTQPTLRTATALLTPSIDIGSSIPTAGQTAVGWSVTGVSGALPASFGAPTSASLGVRMWTKVA